MSDDLISSLKYSAAGMKVQGERLRVISQNIANVDSLPTGPGLEPYRRKQILFKNASNRELGLTTVQVARIVGDPSEFPLRQKPGHPAANGAGLVRAPNINALIEMMDLREAQRSYEANLTSIRTARTMMQKTIDLLR